MNEMDTIEAAQRGNLRAFNELVLTHQTVAYSVAYRLMGNADDAADATQDSFIKAYESLRQFHGGSFRAWLLRIVTNTCYDMLRVRQRRQARIVEETGEDDAPPVEVADLQAGPEDRALHAEMAGMIQEGIAALPDEQRVVLVLADIEGFSYQEIAQIVNTEMGTVKSRLSRARARLRDYLEEHNIYQPRYPDRKGATDVVRPRPQPAVLPTPAHAARASSYQVGCA